MVVQPPAGLPARVQTLREIRTTLAAAGVRPRKRWGQNFLIDGNLMRRLYAAAELTSADTVLEVGAGTGGLTDLLVGSAGRVVVIEIDPVMVGILRERFAGRENVEFIVGDVLSSQHVVNEVLRERLLVYPPAANGRYALVANLPYNIATPLLMNLITSEPSRDAEPTSGRMRGERSRAGARGCWRAAMSRRGPAVEFERLCFTVQKEVADRIQAVPHTSAYGPVSIVLQVACTIERIANVPPSAFWPAPQVASAMLRLDRRPTPHHGGQALVDRTCLAGLAAFVRACFAHRRKTLRYNLEQTVGADRTAALAADLDLGRRPETLSVHEWVALFERQAGPQLARASAAAPV